MSYRVEKDSLGEKQVDEKAYYGIQTLRAVENFPISGIKQHQELVWGVAVIKKAAALAHTELKLLTPEVGETIVKAATEVLEGKFDAHFVVDPYQAGAGTSHHMNVNEVIANRANEMLGGKKGEYKPVQPNDHVNMAQSTNDVIPTAIRLATLKSLEELIPVLKGLQFALEKKSKEFGKILKSGRTHLQDAVPLTLGQEFSGFAVVVQERIREIQERSLVLTRLGIGGTAAGTGMNAHPQYAVKVVEHLKELTGLDVKNSPNLFEAMQSMGCFTELSSALRNLACDMTKIANDFRLLSSGPNTGLDEVRLPAVQPGSSIMPGKVNPVMAEMLNMVMYQVIGNDQTILLGAQAGQLELNVMMPLIGYNLIQNIKLLKNSLSVFTTKCIDGLEAQPEKCNAFFENTLGLATALNPQIGYLAAAEIVKESMKTGKSIKQLVIDKKLLTDKEFDALFLDES